MQWNNHNIPTSYKAYAEQMQYRFQAGLIYQSYYIIYYIHIFIFNESEKKT